MTEANGTTEVQRETNEINGLDVKNIIKFLGFVGKLKHVKRRGWVICNVAEPECVTGHMYRMAMMTFLMDPIKYPGLDRQKCLQMALIHDLAESIIGDITPHCGIPDEEKHRREEAAMKELCGLIGPAGVEICALFDEYENQSTPEAKFVKDLDRFDLLLQAYEYEQRDDAPGLLQEFFTSLNGKIAHPILCQMEREIMEERLKKMQ